VPEELFDLDCPGHYFRRLHSVALSIPCVVGPYSGVHATLTLQHSSVRTGPALRDGAYPRDGDDTERFSDHAGPVQSVVTSSGNQDGGLFDPGERDERYRPFEGSGAISRWRLELPAALPQFDHDTISDVVLHLRYTAREGGAPLRGAAVTRVQTLVAEADQVGLARLFSLRHDFPSEWYAFATATGTGDFATTLRPTHFPYFSRVGTIQITGARLYALTGRDLVGITLGDLDLDALSTGLEQEAGVELSLPRDQQVLVPDDDREVFLVLTYGLT